jgi:SAM-dependent methyltransferase
LREASPLSNKLKARSLPIRTKRVLERNRLAYYRRAANSRFWEDHWRQSFSPAAYQWAEQGLLGYFEKPFVRWLPRDGKILEAGCGLGQIVLALRHRGWDAEGVEFAADTVELVRRHRPDLPIRVGDVTDLDVPDGYYSGYVSLGVVEHHYDGPAPFLREAHRVLRREGIAMASVPHLHPLRLLKARLGLYRGHVDGLEFYQYAFRPGEFTGLMRESGFRVLDVVPYDGFKGIKDEVPILRNLLQWARRRVFLGEALHRVLRNSRFGHMMLVVGRKEQ